MFRSSLKIDLRTVVNNKYKLIFVLDVLHRYMYILFTCLYLKYFWFCGSTSQSTAMVILRLSVSLTSPFPGEQLTSTSFNFLNDWVCYPLFLLFIWVLQMLIGYSRFQINIFAKFGVF